MTPRLRLAGMMGRSVAQTVSQLEHIMAGPGGGTVIDVSMGRLIGSPFGALDGPDVAVLGWAEAMVTAVVVVAARKARRLNLLSDISLSL